MAVYVGVLQILGPGILILLLGSAGLFGTYSLWAVAFGRESKAIIAGLVFGIMAMIPPLLVPSSILPRTEVLDVVLLTTVLEASPVVVAMGWLGYFFVRGGAREVASTRRSRADIHRSD